MERVTFAAKLVAVMALGGVGGILATGLWTLEARGVFHISASSASAPEPLRFGSAASSPLRLAFLGTSLTADEFWPEAVAAAVSECRAGAVAHRVIAKAGAGSEWGLAHLGDALSGRPDALLIEFAANDAALHRGAPLSASADRHRAMIARARAQGTTPILVTMSDARGLERFKRPGLSAYHATYRDLSRETGAGLIDLAPLWEALSDKRSADLMPDGLHPRPGAMEEVALPRLIAALCEARPAD